MGLLRAELNVLHELVLRLRPEQAGAVDACVGAFLDAEIRSDRQNPSTPVWQSFASGYNSCSGTIERKCRSTISSVSSTGLCASSSV
jgi:hypothetical protein